MKKYNNDRVIVHFNGFHYYYTKEKGEQLTKGYTTLSRLKRFGVIKQ